MAPSLLAVASAQPPLLQARLQSHAAATSSAASAVPAPAAPRRRRALAAAAPSRGRRRLPLRVAASYEPFPWNQRDYNRVGLQMVQTSAPVGSALQQGYFLMMKVDEHEMVEDTDNALVISVGGDTLTGVAQLAQGLSTGAAGGRPLSLDLLWQVLQRGQEISKRTWGVLRVAVVELRGNTFVGRVFFGDTATGAVAWDCDCRPSDACWLALKAKAPIYIHKAVWEDCAMPLRDLQRTAEREPSRQQGEKADKGYFQEMARLSGQQVEADEEEELTPTTIMTTPRPRDPEPLKRLKMEMRVALHEEDYAAAARIRDHPFMRLHVAGMQALQIGDLTEADRCEQQLQAAIHQAEEEEARQTRDRGASGGGGGGSPGGPGRQFY